MRRYLVWMGTRPEAIKMCPLVLCLRRCSDVEVRVVLSGQHRDMTRSVLDYFGVEADADLGVMHEGQTPLSLTERLLAAMSRELSESNFVPDAALVHGDTTTAFVGALCCFYAGIPVYHVEAGLRTGDIRAPFPEEFNRRAIDAMSDAFFAPTVRAARQLIAEGAARERVFTVGNTATDALRLCRCEDFSHSLTDAAAGRRLVILTTHRREMSDAERAALLTAVRDEIENREDVYMIYPVHPAPAVRAVAERVFVKCANAVLTPPLELPVLQNLLARATLLLTDSGGLQEEATYLGVPTLVLRDKTERPEGVAAGILHMVGTDAAEVRRRLAEMLDGPRRPACAAHGSQVYGDGYVSEAIVRVLNDLAGASG